ncbi:hypothetical protein ARMGADRAFT_1162344 [Armillaria gallica]|uniref:Uncharacterized protein n=1 Tax=Armillaria gallica TaxID=47427 RepID=A0A2H3DQG0_ARMGA|nr:hypothetical protein ARMGADRAFT_1162344 [Armillaria gallica]
MVVSEVAAVLESSLSSDRVHSETGEMNLITNQDIKAVATEATHPRMLYRYATELQKLQIYEPVGQEGGRSMAVKVSLGTGYTCTPRAKFGLLFSGISAILTKHATYDSGEPTLLVSPHYHLFDDDNPPTSDFCVPHDEDGLPLLAVLTTAVTDKPSEDVLLAKVKSLNQVPTNTRLPSKKKL